MKCRFLHEIDIQRKHTALHFLFGAINSLKKKNKAWLSISYLKLSNLIIKQGVFEDHLIILQEIKTNDLSFSPQQEQEPVLTCVLCDVGLPAVKLYSL